MVKPPDVRLGSRGSQLALWQARHIQARLETARPDLTVHVQVLHTTGDRITDVPLARIGDRGLFTKELDQAILDGHVDLAVHSLKDVPTRLPDGLALVAVTEREDPRDALIVATGRPPRLAGLPAGATIGTSSLRRRAQLLHYRPDLRVEDFRGNLDTRLARVGEGRFDAVILALAGIRRLGHEPRVSELLGPPDWLSAVGQGALAIVARAGDRTIAALAEPLDHAPTRAATTAERAFMRALEGGCQVPIGAVAHLEGDDVVLDGFVASLDGKAYLRADARGPAADAQAVGQSLADDLLRRGAGEILHQVRQAAEGALPGASPP